MRLARTSFLLAMLALPALGLARDDLPRADEPFPYAARGVSLRETLDAVSEHASVPVVADNLPRASVTLPNRGATLRGFLDALALQQNIDWYYDGQGLYVSPTVDRRTLVLPLEQRSLDELRGQLDELGVVDPRFALRTDGDGTVALFTGPPRYAELLEELFPRLGSETTEEASDGQPEAPRGALPGEPARRAPEAPLPARSGAGDPAPSAFAPLPPARPQVLVIRGQERTIQTVPY